MRKELLIAVILGLSLGLVITYGFYRARQALVTPDYNAIVLEESSPTPEASILGTLSILSPPDELVTTDETIQVTGATLADTYVAIYVNDQHYLTTADATGNFSQPVSLQNGSNVIAIHALDESGATTVMERVIIRTTSAASPTATTSASPAASGSAQP